MSAVFYPRFAQRAVDEAIRDTPIVVIQGARQVGKITLAGVVAGRESGSVSITLDDRQALDLAKTDPMFFLRPALDAMLVIDEAQRVPELVLPIKSIVDRNRRPGMFLFTGSADLLQVKGVGDSLAGRAETIELKPLSQGELARRPNPEDFVRWLLVGEVAGNFDELDPATVLTGGYPEMVQRKQTRAHRWVQSYIERLSSRDARELQDGQFADTLLPMVKLVASQGISEIVKSKVARSLNIGANTVDSYLRLLQIMRLSFQVPGWGRTPKSKVVRRSKLSLNDTGLSAGLAGFTSQQALAAGGREYYGSLVEQFVALELDKQATWTENPFRCFHYRDAEGLEVDLILELADGSLVAIEVKSSLSVNAKSWQNLIRFKERFSDRSVTGVCLYAGESSHQVHDWLYVLPITSLWQH